MLRPLNLPAEAVDDVVLDGVEFGEGHEIFFLFGFSRESLKPIGVYT